MDGLLSDRIARLENVARRERAIAIGLLALLMATGQAPAPTSSGPVIITSSTSSATLDSRGLTVRDHSRELLFAGLDSSGKPSLDLSDSAGRLRESMYLLAGNPILRDFDAAGKRRAEVFLAGDSGNGEFLIFDAAEVRRLALFHGSSGLPEFALYGSDAKVRAYLSTDDGMPYLGMNDNGGATRLVMGAYTGGRAGMDVRDSAGKALWSQPK